jgi:uncharacterized membrane protein
LEEMTAMMFGYGGTGDGWPVWAAVLMGIGMLASLGVLIWVGYALMTNATRRSHQQRRGGQGTHERRSGADAREILDERLARGEIDATEYQRLRGLIAVGDDQAPAGSASRR